MTTHVTGQSVDRPANHLAGETSPYLLQHAHNPVDWRPWGLEAFAEAQRRQAPIFLSIGYSTCYWCHVMERESFEDQRIADLMNEHFVCIKVDREERPDVDDIYMAAVQLLTGRGGWPMSVWLTPPDADGEGGLQPFYAGTYFPPTSRRGMPGFDQILTSMATAWREQRDDVLAQAQRSTEAVAGHLAALAEPVGLSIDIAMQAVDQLLAMHDSTHGGFGRAPKFPQPVFLELLMAVRQAGVADAQIDRIDHAVRLTLDRMAMGGVYDHVGGGFHRYSTDAHWLVPHFEKMLYDNAQLASLYAASVQHTGDAYHAQVLRETLDYVLREMTDPEGAFYSAQDAEVNHHEGKNYLWQPDQIEVVLGPDDAAFVNRVYGLDGGTNFQDPHDPEQPASNVLHLTDHPSELAKSLDMDEAVFQGRLTDCNARLLEARAKRDQPGLDDKVITAWNGLMIAGLADGGRALGEDRYIDAASRAADFILTTMVDEDGALLRTWRRSDTGDAAARLSAGLEDHAFLIHGLIALYNATGKQEYLGRALLLTGEARRLFWDEQTGGYFDTQPGRSDLIVRSRSTYDGALPSASGVMLGNLIDLAELTRDEALRHDAAMTLSALSTAIRESPVAAVNATRHMLRLAQAHPELLPTDDDPSPAGDPESPVTIMPSTDRLRVNRGAPAMLDVTLRIADGWHVNAHDPGDASLIATEVYIVGAEGLTTRAEYPAGEAYGPDESLRVYRGTVTIPVTVEQTGDVMGAPRLIVTVQPCTDSECQAPIHRILDVRIESE